MSAVPITTERNLVRREEFGASQVQSAAETAVAGVTAREQARTNAMFVMAERHPRNWDTVRVNLLAHCDRPRFAEIARYKKPAGKKKINGQWVDTFAEGLSARFAEIARQEMGNSISESTVVYEDDLIRIVRAGVMDVQRNNLDSREITVAKVVEKRGKQDNKTGEWAPPEGREVIGNPRVNTYGEPVFLVKATDDEIRNKQNSEISKAQRDESLRLIPKDIRDDCEDRIRAVLADPKKTDPTAARKRLVDAFATLGILPDDLVQYIGTALDRVSPVQLDELRGLYTAVHDGETDFQTALRLKYDQPAASREEREELLNQKLTTAAADKPVRSETKSEPPAASVVQDATAQKAHAPAQPATGPKAPSITEYEGDWPENPQGDLIRWNGVLYRSNEDTGNYQKADEPAEAPQPAQAKREKPVFGRGRTQ